MNKTGGLILIALLLVGCATTSTVKNARGTGQARVYDASYDDVFDAAVNAFLGNSIEIVEEDRASGALIGKKGMNLLTTWGERVAVYVYKLDETHTKAEVISRRVSELDAVSGAKNWTKTIFSDIERKLSMKRSS